MDYERLIHLVKGYEELYNVHNSRYCDHLHKEAVWRNIAHSMNLSAIRCKKAWINLRDSFRRTIRKRREGIECNVGKKRKKWRYEEQMSFLIPHFQDRDTHLYHATEKEESGDKNLEPSIKDEADSDMNSLVGSDEDLADPSCQDQEALTAGPSCKIPPLDSRQIASGKPDALDLFLASMAASIRKFPPYYQNIAKSKIFAAVSEIELGLILNYKSSSPQPLPQKGVGVHFLE